MLDEKICMENDHPYTTESPYFRGTCYECGIIELRNLIKGGFPFELIDELEANGFVTTGDSWNKAERAYKQPEIMRIFSKYYPSIIITD